MAEKKPQKGSPPWMATFADMSTLLLTFFVIMLSMSTIDVIKFKAMLGSIKDAMGVQVEIKGEFEPVVDPNMVPVTEDVKRHKQEFDPESLYGKEKEEEAMKREAEQQRAVADIEEAIKDTGLGDMAEVRSGARGIRIRVKGALLFAPGQAQLKSQAYPFLNGLVEVIKKFDYYALVEGHTDSTPINTPQFPSNWELSSFRAAAVLRYLIAQGISPQRLTSIGLADNYPIATNETPEGRAKNRRVEFVLAKEPFRQEID